LTSFAWSKLLEADRVNRPPHTTDEDDPVIATVRRHHLTKPVLSELVVDDDPPRPVWRSGAMLVITLATRHGEVHLHEMRPVVHLRQPPRRACFGLTGSYAAGVVPSRIFTLDLDPVPALLKAEDEYAGSTFKITPTDSEEFRVTISAIKAEVSFHLEIDWTCVGRNGTTVINNYGKPFEVYPAGHRDLDWGCGGRHKSGCPAERLAATSSQGRVRWFDKSSDSGFIIPDSGGADLYFHRKSLVPGGVRRLPCGGDLVAYEVERTKFEPRAVRVRFR
jgi:cold shock CspA family protein